MAALLGRRVHHLGPESDEGGPADEGALVFAERLVLRHWSLEHRHRLYDLSARGLPHPARLKPGVHGLGYFPS